MGVSDHMTYKTKVITINEGGSNNLGDQAICRSLNKFLLAFNNIQLDNYNFSAAKKISKENQENQSIVDKKKSRIPFKKNLTKIKLIIKIHWLLKKILIIRKVAADNYDIAIIGGGQLILSNSIFPIAMFTWVLLLKVYGSKVYIIGVGSGEKFTFLEKILYKMALSLSTKIFLRDNSSIEIVKNKFNIKANLIPDLAFYFNEQKKIKNNRENKKRVYIIGIVEYPVYMLYKDEMNNPDINEEEYIELWGNEIISSIKETSIIKLISTTPEDIIASNKLYNFLIHNNKRNHQVYVEDSFLSLDEYFDNLKSADVVISARMHSLILGQVAGCKIIPWNISKKIESYSFEYLDQNLGTLNEKTLKIIQDIMYEK